MFYIKGPRIAKTFMKWNNQEGRLGLTNIKNYCETEGNVVKERTDVSSSMKKHMRTYSEAALWK